VLVCCYKRRKEANVIIGFLELILQEIPTYQILLTYAFETQFAQSLINELLEKYVMTEVTRIGRQSCTFTNNIETAHSLRRRIGRSVPPTNNSFCMHQQHVRIA